MKKIMISKILYALAIASFCGYLITNKSALMASGGLFMIGGALFMISTKINKK